MTRKLRPYDEPPKRRRSLIPNAPDSAGGLFLVVAILWLLAAAGIGMLAAAERLFPDVLKVAFNVPFGSGIGVEITRANVDRAFVDALVYGWLSNAAFAAIFFVTPRLTGARLASDAVANMGLAAWNLAVAAGIALLCVKGASSVGSLAEFPLLVKGLALLGLLAVNGAFWRTLLPIRGLPYISLLYFGIGLLALLGLFALSAIPGVISLGTTNDQLLWAFTARGVLTYWILGATIGTLYYVVPRATRNPLYSSGLALLAFLGWLAFAGLSAIGALVDPSVPYVITSLGQAGTLLLLAPTLLAIANLLATISGRWSLILSPGVIQFATASVAFLFVTALLESVGALRGVQRLTAGTDWELGVLVLGLLGGSTFAFFAFADHALPRILRKGWGENVLVHGQLWAALAGAVLAGFAMIASGLVEGSILAEGGAPDPSNLMLLAFRIAAGGGLSLVALGGFALLVNVFLLYTEGRPAQYALPSSESAPAAAGH